MLLFILLSCRGIYLKLRIALEVRIIMVMVSIIVTSSIFTEIGFFETESAAKKTVCIRTPTSDPKYFIEECCTFDVDEEGKPTGSDATCRRSICPVDGGNCSDIPSKIPTTSGPLQEGEILEQPTTLPEVSVLEAQRANVTRLPGGIIQEANTSSNDSSSSILGMQQSDLVSDEAENTTGTVNDGEEQDESGPSKEQAREGADETDDKENIDEELPLE
jgi:hypothetical protein